jgi:hypothetical protein
MSAGIGIEATIDLLYGPIYYRLQMGAGPISESCVDKVFEQAMEGHLDQSKRGTGTRKVRRRRDVAHEQDR